MAKLLSKVIKIGYPREELICPFFGVSETLCQKGCGYVNEKEANSIIKKCLNYFDNCSRYLELVGGAENKSFISLKSKFYELIKNL